MHRRYLLLALVVVVAAVPAFAGHSWSTYHWKKGTGQIAPPVHDNVDSKWDSYFTVAAADWNDSLVIESPFGSAYGPISAVKRCSSATGKIEVCNARYGQTGWLGIAGISLSGGHIVKGYTKLNDTYFDTAKYNTPAWRRMVMCQEIGHDYGLGHVNETFDDPNTGSCMDYTNDPSRNDGAGTNEYPNAHDYDQLELMYGHTDSASVVVAFSEMTSDATRPKTLEEIYFKADQWGTPIAFDGNGKPNVFRLKVGANHEGHDEEILTHVFWAPEDPFQDRPGTPGRPGNNQ